MKDIQQDNLKLGMTEEQYEIYMKKKQQVEKNKKLSDDSGDNKKKVNNKMIKKKIGELYELLDLGHEKT